MTSRFQDAATAVVLTVSDRCSDGRQVDRSGPAVARILADHGMTGVGRARLPDEIGDIAHALRHYAAEVDLIVTTGGTGLAPRDVTPEATTMVCDRFVDGLSERMRAEGLKQTPMAVLSRGVCGCIGDTLVINLPGSVAGAETSLLAIIELLPHALELLAGRGDHE
jgi:molybdenum cofactor synthesis domain-containing protein